MSLISDVADVLISLSYFCIPAELLWFGYKHKDMLASNVSILFTTFISLCGTTHVLNVIELNYLVIAIIKCLTAAVSITTCIYLAKVIPKVLGVQVILRDAIRQNENNKNIRNFSLKLRQYLEESHIITTSKKEIEKMYPEFYVQFGRQIRDSEHFEITPNNYMNMIPYSNQKLNTEEINYINDLVDQIKFMLEQCTILDDCKNKNISLQNVNDRLRIVSEREHDLYAYLSHEIRSSLSGIICITEIMEDSEKSLSKREHLKLIKTAGETILELICNILDMRSIDSGKVKLEEIKVNLLEICQNICDIERIKHNNTGKQLILECPNEIKILGDPSRIKQMITNLVCNAMKFVNEHTGKVNICVKYIYETEQNMTLYIKVQDNGIGISNERLNTIFEPFSQDKDTYRNYGGTGLGLSIVNKLVSTMNGYINVKSQLNVGTLFELYIPCKKYQNTITSFYLTDITSLIISKDELVIKSLSYILSNLGCMNVVICRESSEDIIKKKEFDYIFKDDDYYISVQKNGIFLENRINKQFTTEEINNLVK